MRPPLSPCKYSDLGGCGVPVLAHLGSLDTFGTPDKSVDDRLIGRDRGLGRPPGLRPYDSSVLLFTPPPIQSVSFGQN